MLNIVPSIQAIGNYEFNNGPEGLAEFLQDANFPVMSCTIVDNKAPVIQGLYQKSNVFTFGEQQVAVIGYTYWNTGEIAPVGMLECKNTL